MRPNYLQYSARPPKLLVSFMAWSELFSVVTLVQIYVYKNLCYFLVGVSLNFAVIKRSNFNNYYLQAFSLSVRVQWLL